MSDTNCDRKRFVGTLEDPRACQQRGGSCGCYFYKGRIHASKPATRGRKAGAINFYGYCLTNANAIIVFKPLSSTVYLAEVLDCKIERKIDSNWTDVGGGRVEVLLPFLAARPEEAIKSYEPASACKNMRRRKKLKNTVTKYQFE